VIELHSNGGRVITEGPYAGDGTQNPYSSDFIVPKNFTEQEKEDLVAFLRSLTDTEFVTNPKISDPFKEQ
jgi:cytochrome c peroxidase